MGAASLGRRRCPLRRRRYTTFPVRWTPVALCWPTSLDPSLPSRERRSHDRGLGGWPVPGLWLDVEEVRKRWSFPKTYSVDVVGVDSLSLLLDDGVKISSRIQIGLLPVLELRPMRCQASCAAPIIAIICRLVSSPPPASWRPPHRFPPRRHCGTYDGSRTLRPEGKCERRSPVHLA